MSDSNILLDVSDTETVYIKNIYEDISFTHNFKWSWVREFLSNLPPRATVYDLVYGNGNGNKSHKYAGLDYCDNFIKICKDKHLNVLKSNITKISLPDESADAILCISVLHNLSTYENRLAAIMEMSRLIKPDGKIIISVWSISQPKKIRRAFSDYGNNIVIWDSYDKIFERYYYIYRLNELRDLFSMAGLKILNYEYSCGNEVFTMMKYI